MKDLSLVLLQLTRGLYPTGRAFNLPTDELPEAIHKALNKSEERALNEGSLATLSTILPDNDAFDTQDATDWERRLKITRVDGATLDDRKAAILRKYSSPGGVLGRQAPSYIEDQLQAANFNVFLVEDTQDIDGIIGARYGASTSRLGNIRSSPNPTGFEIVANRIRQADEDFVLPADRSAVFLVGGQNPGDIADVPLVRRDEFRALILTLKPAQSVALLLVNYT